MPFTISRIDCHTCSEHLEDVNACLRHIKSAQHHFNEQDDFEIITQFICEYCHLRFDNVRDCLRHEKAHQCVDQAVNTPNFHYDFEIIDENRVFTQEPPSKVIEANIESIKQTPSTLSVGQSAPSHSAIKVVIAPKEQLHCRGRRRGSKNKTCNSNEIASSLKHVNVKNPLIKEDSEIFIDYQGDEDLKVESEVLSNAINNSETNMSICDERSSAINVDLDDDDYDDNYVRRALTNGKNNGELLNKFSGRSRAECRILKRHILEYYDKLPGNPTEYRSEGKSKKPAKVLHFRCKPCKEQDKKEKILKETNSTFHLERHLKLTHHLDLSAIYLNKSIHFPTVSLHNERKRIEERKRVMNETLPYFEPFNSTGHGADRRIEYHCKLCLKNGVNIVVRDPETHCGSMRRHLTYRHSITIGDGVPQKRYKAPVRLAPLKTPQQIEQVKLDLQRYFNMVTPLDPNNFQTSIRVMKKGSLVERRYQTADFICVLCSISIRCTLTSTYPLRKHLKNAHKLDLGEKFQRV